MLAGRNFVRDAPAKIDFNLNDLPVSHRQYFRFANAQTILFTLLPFKVVQQSTVQRLSDGSVSSGDAVPLRPERLRTAVRHIHTLPMTVTDMFL